jgi:hypothetical protein
MFQVVFDMPASTQLQGFGADQISNGAHGGITRAPRLPGKNGHSIDVVEPDRCLVGVLDRVDL